MTQGEKAQAFFTAYQRADPETRAAVLDAMHVPAGDPLREELAEEIGSAPRC